LGKVLSVLFLIECCCLLVSPALPGSRDPPLTVLLSIANKYGLVILQFDFVSAFTNSDLDELVYTKGLLGYSKKGRI
jgi:hypothetical protein